jgi:hypothetical protein
VAWLSMVNLFNQCWMRTLFFLSTRFRVRLMRMTVRVRYSKTDRKPQFRNESSGFQSWRTSGRKSSATWHGPRLGK